MNRRDIKSYDLRASETLTASARKLLREYSGIEDDEAMDKHVEDIRVKAFAVAPYPCVGMFQFLDLSLVKMPIYPEVLSRVQNGAKFLDLGCCLGQEIRQLVLDGAPSANTYGSDLYPGFFTVGYDLFSDNSDTLHTTFIAADIFDESSELVRTLAGKMDIIYTGAFFHLFNLGEQEKVAERVIQLLTLEKGTMVIGRQTGSDEPGEFFRAGDKEKNGRSHYRHSPQTWTDLWDRVGQKTGTKWEVQADLGGAEYTLAKPEGKKAEEIERKMSSEGLRFVVRRV